MRTQLGIASVALALAFGLQAPTFAAGMDSKEKADAQSIDTACAADAKTTGCSGKEVGKGLLKCMSEYAKANKSFKHTPGCESAIKQMHTDEKAEGGGMAKPAAGTSK